MSDELRRSCIHDVELDSHCMSCHAENSNPVARLREMFYDRKERVRVNAGIRKEAPVFSGVLMYFPDAMMEISRHSKKGNDKHNPGQPLHWAKEKSKDHADCIARHLIDIGQNWDARDPETDSYHATALAWRALALLQTLLERGKKNSDSKS